MAADPESAASEWEGGFRNDISGYLDDETIEAAVLTATTLSYFHHETRTLSNEYFAARNGPKLRAPCGG